MEMLGGQDDNVMKRGMCVLLMRGKFLKICNLRNENQSQQIGKDLVSVGLLIGHEFGSIFKLIKGDNKSFNLERVIKNDDGVPSTSTVKKTSGEDNRNVIDSHGKCQKLSRDDISELKDQGIIGSAIVEKLIGSSSTYEMKTEYAQEKYISKKQKKYYDYIVALKPTIRMISQLLYQQDPMKILNLRPDTLSILISHCNVHSGGKYIVFESGSMGLAVASLLYRLNGDGRVIHFFHDKSPNRPVVDMLNFSSRELSCLWSVNIREFKIRKKLSSKTSNHGVNMSSEKCQPDTAEGCPLDGCSHLNKSLCTQAMAIDLLEKESFDGLVIVSKPHPLNILLKLKAFLGVSRPFAIYSPYKETLVECYNKLKIEGEAIALKLSETWFRDYQVLPDRTHPSINMSGGGGYLLTGIKVDNT